MRRVVSTFSGCGGSSLGYHLAGFRVALAVEWDAHAVSTYRRNFPGTPVFHGDVGELSGARARELAGLGEGEELDVLDGSPPCQGFSRMKGQRDVDDERNLLFQQYARLLRELRPRAFIMENVAAMAMGKMRPVFDAIIAELRGCGYRVRARVLDAQWYGVPQSRERMIFVGVREDLGVEPRHPAPTVARPVTAGEAVEGVVLRDKPELVDPRFQRMWLRMRPGRTLKQDVMLRIGSESYFGTVKLDPNRPAHTICRMVGIKGFATPMHWAEPRVMAIEEIQRLASFPDSFVFEGTFKERWARIGNCVPPLLMRAVAAELGRVLDDVDLRGVSGGPADDLAGASTRDGVVVDAVAPARVGDRDDLDADSPGNPEGIDPEGVGDAPAEQHDAARSELGEPG